MLRYSALALILFLHSSCAPLVYINDDGYRNLTDEQFKNIRQFNDPPPTDEADKYIVEMTTDDLVKSFDKANYTWVYQWVPYCGANECRPLFYYDRILDGCKDKGMQLFIISNVYTYSSVKKRADQYSGDIYVLRDEDYGHKTGKRRNKFAEELIAGGHIQSREDFYDHMIFRGDSLIYSCSNSKMSSATMDSVLKPYTVTE